MSRLAGLWSGLEPIHRYVHLFEVALFVGLLALVAALCAALTRKRQHLLQKLREWKESKKTLRQAQELLQAQKQVLDQYAMVTQADASGKITYCNDRFLAVTQYQRDDIIGQSHRKLKSGEHNKAFWESFWNTLFHGHVWKGEICNRAKDGSLFWVDAIVVPFPGENGKPERYLSIQTVITERKSLEQELRRAKEAAEGAAQAKAAFLANMSHEIRTPMNAILGMTRLLLNTELTVKQREFAEIASQAGGALLRIINDVLDISKIEADRMPVECSDFDLAPLVKGVVQMFYEQGRERRLDIRCNVSPDIPARLCGDAGRLRQVLTNLMSNACKFTKEGKVQLQVMALTKTEDGVHLRFEVSDTGIGISPAVQRRLFQPFSQGDSSVTRLYGGTGLGLAISKSLVERMGGTMGLKSAHRKGSTFWFTLQFKKAACQDSPAPVAEAPVKHVDVAVPLLQEVHARILVVEDNRFNQILASQLLSDLGVDADFAEDGAEALRLVTRRRYDLIFMDVQMPKMDGYETTRKLRLKTRQHKRIPVIAMTAQAMPGDREKCLEAGMDDYMAKPFTPEDLLSKLMNWLPTVPKITTLPAKPKEILSGDYPVNLAMLKQATRGDSRAFLRLCNVYLRQAERSIDDLRKAAHPYSPDQVRMKAHAWAGSSACFGAASLADRLYELEQIGKDKRPEAEARQALQRVEVEYSRLMAYMNTQDHAA